MNDILDKVHEAGLTLKAGCGIGYEFSTLRPKGAYVTGAGAYTSGPLSFMDIYDRMCFTVSSAGGRRGAQMATFDVGHPDVLDFIRVKREDGRLRQFNLSLLITPRVHGGGSRRRSVEARVPAHAGGGRARWRRSRRPGSGGVAKLAGERRLRHQPLRKGCLPGVSIRAGSTDLGRHHVVERYDFAEPGFILIDEINEMNNNWFCENIRATNPCGEQPLPPYGSCLLGSINLTRFVLDPFTDRARFDWETFREVVAVFTRMLDNVVEVNGLPLGPQRDEIMRKRRHGMGYLGLGST